MSKDKSKKRHKQFVSAEDESKATLHKNLNFTATEQYKLIRSNLEFTLPQDEKCPVIGITSPMRGEGKSTTAVNLSYVLSEKGKKVLLIDGDLRLPSIAKKLQIEAEPGLTDLLKDSGVQLSDFQVPVLDNWYILPSGNIPPNPSELLGSNRMKSVLTKLKVIFDYIIIDLPPVNLVSDASSVSPLISGMIVVVREEVTQKKELERCFRQLQLSGANVLGVVWNAERKEKLFYGNKYKYRKYKYSRYYYYKKSDKTDSKGSDNDRLA